MKLTRDKSIKNIFKGVLIYGVTNALKSLVPFFLVPILTLYLTSEEYGVLSMIDVFVLMLMPFISVNCVGAVNVSYFKLDKDNLKQYISTALLLNTVLFILLSLIFYVFKNKIGEFLDIPAQYIILVPFFCWVRIIPLLLLVLFQARLEPFKYALYAVLQAILDLGITFYLVKYTSLTIEGRLLGVYFSFFVFGIIGVFVLLKEKLFSFRLFYKKHLKHLLNFGIPLIPHALGATIIAMSDRFFIAHFKGASEVGIYTVAYQIAAVMLLLGTSINQASVPILYKKLKENLRKGSFFFKKLAFVLIVSFVGVTGVVYFLSDYLFFYFVDENFFDAKKYFPFLLLGFLFQVLYFIFTNILFFFEKTKLLAKITFIGASINILLNYFLIRKLGVIGVAYATAITYFLYFLVVMCFSNNILKSKIRKEI